MEPGGRVQVDAGADGETLTLRRDEQRAPVPERSRPVVLVLDENAQLVERLQRELANAGVTPLVAASAQQARDLANRQRVDLAIVDLLLPDGDGLSVAFELVRLWPRLRIVLMTGMELTPDEAAICQRQDIPILRKPFLAEDLVRFIQPALLNWPRRGARVAAS